MADNVAITAGTGTTIAADDIGGVLHQRVKISQGADGSATDVSSAAPLQVTLANTGANTNKLLVTPDLPSGAATAAKQPALGTAGTASSDVISIQGIASMTKILTTPDLPSGASTGAKQDTGNTSLASIDGKITAVNTGAVVVSSSALPSGAATSAKQDTGNTSLGAINTDTTAINVDTTAIKAVVQTEDAAHSSGHKGVMALAVREATATDLSAGNTDGDYEPLQVDANGKLHVNPGTVTVTGTVTANAGTNLNTSALALESGGNLATISALSKAEDAAHSTGHTGVMALAVRQATATDMSAGNTDGDYEPLQVDANGKLHVNPGTVTVASHAVTNAGTFAVQATEADGANTTLGAKADAKSTATDTTAVSAMSVLKQISASVQAPPSQAVTNAGTFAVQATLQANSGVDIGKLTANQSVNVAQINGVTTTMGNGASGTGVQRVTIANDSTGIINAKSTVLNTYNSVTALTITIASLANSSTDVGRQSTLVDNTSTKYKKAKIYCKITVGTSPTANTLLYVYLIQDNNDSTPIRDDGAGASDAAWTHINAPLLGTIRVPATTSDTAYYGIFDTDKVTKDLGPKWAIGLVNASGATLNATGGNHVISYIGTTDNLT